MKKAKVRRFLRLFAAAALTLLSACELLFDKPDGDLMKDVEEAVDYSRAPYINARVVSMGTVGMVTMDVSGRKIGYPFDVQATANPGYGFVGWVALRSADWEARPGAGLEAYIRQKAASSPGLAAISNAANMDGALTGAAVVTVHTGEAIVLVPFCVRRPSVYYSNPSKGEGEVSYSRPVRIRLTSPVAADSFRWQDGEVPPAGTRFKNIFITGVRDGGSGAAIEGIENRFGDPVLSENGLDLSIQLRSDETIEAQSQITITLGNNIRLRDYPEVSFATEESINYTVKAPDPTQIIYPVVKSGTLKGSRNSDFDPEFDNTSQDAGVGNPMYIKFKFEGYNGGNLPSSLPVSQISVVEVYDGSTREEVVVTLPETISSTHEEIVFSYTPRKTTTGLMKLVVIPENSEGHLDLNATVSSGSYLDINLVDRPTPIAFYTAEYTGGNIELTTTNGNAAVSGIKVRYTSRIFDHAGVVTPGTPGSANDTPNTGMNGVTTWTPLGFSAASWVFDRDTGGYTKTGDLTEYTFTVTTLNAIGIESAPETFTIWNIEGMRVQKTTGSTVKAHAITSLSELQTMAGNINNGQDNGDDVYVLTKDIELLTTWTPIGTADPVTADVSAASPANTKAFRGSFYGTGHKISNLILPGGAVYYNGFFGFTDNALIDALALEYNGSQLSLSTSGNRQFIGITAGLARNTSIRNVNVYPASTVSLGPFACLRSGCPSICTHEITRAYINEFS
jgi:hypothetical protein